MHNIVHFILLIPCVLYGFDSGTKLGYGPRHDFIQRHIKIVRAGHIAFK